MYLTCLIHGKMHLDFTASGQEQYFVLSAKQRIVPCKLGEYAFCRPCQAAPLALGQSAVVDVAVRHIPIDRSVIEELAVFPALCHKANLHTLHSAPACSALARPARNPASKTLFHTGANCIIMFAYSSCFSAVI